MRYIIWTYASGSWLAWCNAPLSLESAARISAELRCMFGETSIVLPLGEEPSFDYIALSEWEYCLGNYV